MNLSSMVQQFLEQSFSTVPMGKFPRIKTYCHGFSNVDFVYVMYPPWWQDVSDGINGILLMVSDYSCGPSYTRYTIWLFDIATEIPL